MAGIVLSTSPVCAQIVWIRRAAPESYGRVVVDRSTEGVRSQDREVVRKTLVQSDLAAVVVRVVSVRENDSARSVDPRQEWRARSRIRRGCAWSVYGNIPGPVCPEFAPYVADVG